MTSKEPFTLMVKPVGSQCNMGCSYCYYLENREGGRERVMAEETLSRLIRGYIEGSPGPVVSFTWHGGEPTLAGLDFYRRVVAIQKEAVPDGWQCWNSLQTNGLLLDDAWCAFLKEEGFDVGVSIDGISRFHDVYRKDREGNGTYERVAGAVKRLQSHGIQPDLLCTLPAAYADDPLSVYRSLREFGTGWIQFIPIVRRGEEGAVVPPSISGEQYGEFLCEVFDEWLYHDFGQGYVQLFAEAMLCLSGGESNLCWMAPVCGKALVVERDGSVYSCDHFVDHRHRIGDLEEGLQDILQSPFQRRFSEEKQENLSRECQSCPVLLLCWGGCPKDRLGEQGKNHLCVGLLRIFSYIREPLTQMIALQKRGMPPSTVREEMGSWNKKRWQGVKRNDPCICGSGKKAKQCCWNRRP